MINTKKTETLSEHLVQHKIGAAETIDTSQSKHLDKLVQSSRCGGGKDDCSRSIGAGAAAGGG